MNGQMPFLGNFGENQNSLNLYNYNEMMFERFNNRLNRLERQVKMLENKINRLENNNPTFLKNNYNNDDNDNMYML